MKKIIFFTLFSLSLFAQGGAYFGASYGAYNEAFTKGNGESTTTNSMSLKVGYGVRSAYAVEFNIEKTNNISTSLTDASNNNIDIIANSKLGMNLSLVKAFDPGIYLLPFVKAGFGAGKISVVAIGKDLQGADKNVDKLNYGSFNIGLGFLIPLGENFDVEVVYDYKYLTYENLDASTTSQEKGSEFESHVNTTYMGINYRF